MNIMMIKQLIYKDWYFNRSALALYAAIGGLALMLFAMANEASFYVGTVLLVSMVITIGIHLVITTVIQERKLQTLPFVMSLPVSYLDYTIAKLALNLAAFIVPWALLFVGASSIILYSENIPDGLLPLASIIMIELAFAYVLVLSVAMITESEVITIVTITICNVSVSLFWFFIGSFTEISDYTHAESPVWNATAISMIAIELTGIVILIAFTFYWQSRKRDFL